MAKRTSVDWKAAREALERAQEILERPPVSAAAMERVFRDRARALAHPPPAPAEEASLGQMIVFHLGEERFAFPLGDIAEAIAHPVIAPVPGAPATTAGVMQVRGEIRPVFDLARLLAIDRTVQDAVLLIRFGQNEIGFQVGEIEGIRKQEGRAPKTPGNGRVLLVTPDLVQLLSPEKLIAEIQEEFGAF